MPTVRPAAEAPSIAEKLTGMPPKVCGRVPSSVNSASTGSSRAKSTKSRNGPVWAFVEESAFAEELPQPRRSDKPMKVELASLRHGRFRACEEGLICLSCGPLYRGDSAAGMLTVRRYG
ncbi:hypothetical protein FRZ44_15500 [Hypericibacter terrae]|uniref:Uncharacterized protein n=1 Tax=Hypericibacter terrae TaxID=2602015 RepID=A0A5J6MGM4_9PROT|nr:hypothetical protein FRZ44_15500 [Hypericibacter terrae]